MPIKIDTSRLDKKLTDVVKTIQEEGKRVIDETAEQAVKTIVSRTRRSSRDKDGKQFKPYSSQYKKQRQKAGATTRVVLTSAGKTTGGKTRKTKKRALRGNAQGGSMLNSLTVVRVEDGGLKRVISVARQKELLKLEGHVLGKGRLPVRNPMGFTEPEEKKLIKRAERQMTAAIQKVGLK
jgi:hypothetical protein